MILSNTGNSQDMSITFKYLTSDFLLFKIYWCSDTFSYKLQLATLTVFGGMCKTYPPIVASVIFVSEEPNEGEMHEKTKVHMHAFIPNF